MRACGTCRYGEIAFRNGGEHFVVCRYLPEKTTFNETHWCYQYSDKIGETVIYDDDLDGKLVSIIEGDA